MKNLLMDTPLRLSQKNKNSDNYTTQNLLKMFEY